MANLVELFDNIVQMQNLNGVPLAAGKLYVYALGRTRLMDSWSDVDGESLNPNPIILDDAGQAHVYVSDDFDYTLVVCDQYNNEIFSLDKYLYSKGSHSHADVAVAPSESIAVSSYHVGECTVYVPYLTGQLGKVYEGIDPIVVNNTEDKISANHVPLGVQDPLYFVQDDEEGCIIGFSGETIPEGTMNESAFGYEDGQITSYNGSAFSAGNTYEAGSYVDIDGNTINVTGLQPAGEYVTSGDLDEYTKRTDFDAAISSLNSSKLDVNVYSSQSATFLTAHQSLEGYATEQWVENKGYLTAVPDNYATTGDLQTVSGDITALIPSTAGLATENWVTSQGYITAVPNGTLNASGFEYDGDKISAYNGSAFVGQGGGVTGDFELSAGSGISIVDYPLEQKTVISVTAQGGNPEVEQAVIDNSATWNDVTAKADSTAIPSLDGYATEDWVTAQGYLTTAYNPEFAYHDTAISSIDNSALYDNSAHARITTLAGRISTLSSEKLDATASSNFYTTANESGFITGVDLTPYQTVEGMTAYQEVGDYYSASNPSGFITGVDLTPYQTTAEMTGYMTTAERADFYTTANESGFITEVPDTYLQNTDLSTEDGKVTAISGIPLSAGGDVPEGVMVESGLEYNAVNEISGYNGSAIAQYGAEKQWLTHDDTIVHVSNSAQYAFGVNLSGISADLARMMGVDETVLWTGDVSSLSGNSTGTYNEPLSSFKTIRMKWRNNDGGSEKYAYFPGSGAISYMTDIACNRQYWKSFTVVNAGYTGFGAVWGYEKTITNTATANQVGYFHLLEVIGIGRKN